MERAHVHGLSGSLGLLAFYFAVMGYFQGVDPAIENFLSLWYVMVPLVIGFGIQVGLYSYARSSLKALSAASAAASGGISTGSMVACCAHHISDVLPLLGLSAAAAFLVKFQMPLILVGILSNAIGITMMLEMLKRHGLIAAKQGHEKHMISIIGNHDYGRIKSTLLLISPLIIAFSFVLAAEDTSGTTASGSLILEKLIKEENSLTIEAEPVGFDPASPVKFSLKFDTHSDSLDFDPAAVSVLEDSDGNEYRAISWKGVSESSHHRQGILEFPKIRGRPKEIRLIIRGVYGVQERAFSWKIQ